MNDDIFNKITLDDECFIYNSEVIGVFDLNHSKFLKIWELHPAAYHTIKIVGKEVLTPRWQQAYGKNYRYTGSKNNALPMPEELKLFYKWSKENVDDKLNGILVNWYDGSKGHYIGAHRDDTRDLHENSPVVTISLGQERVFRMRPYKKKGYKDITVRNGEVIIVPWKTNEKWTHEVPKFKKYEGKRISITLRAYK